MEKKTGGFRRLAELGQKTMLLASNILAVPEGYSPAPGLKTLQMERAENPPPPLPNNQRVLMFLRRNPRHFLKSK